MHSDHLQILSRTRVRKDYLNLRTKNLFSEGELKVFQISCTEFKLKEFSVYIQSLNSECKFSVILENKSEKGGG